MNVNSLQSSVYASESRVPPDVRNLSSEAMLAYCETRLRDIDQGMQAQMNDQTALMNRKKAINTAVTRVKHLETPGEETRDSVFNTIESAARALPEGDPTRKYLEGLRGTWEKKLNEAGNNLKGKWAEFKAELESKSSELGAESEMSMMKLQSVVSQRQTIISLITNIMAKMQQATEQIVANIKS